LQLPAPAPGQGRKQKYRPANALANCSQLPKVTAPIPALKDYIAKPQTSAKLKRFCRDPSDPASLPSNMAAFWTLPAFLRIAETVILLFSRNSGQKTAMHFSWNCFIWPRPGDWCEGA